jgi:hypothetical protein
MTSSAAAGLLARQLKQMQTDKDIPGISCGLVDNNIFEWEVMLMISDECRYYGGTRFSYPLGYGDLINSYQVDSSAHILRSLRNILICHPK